MKKVRLILVGGVLGSGKTTLLFEAARKLIARGKRVGLVTNDQAPGNVDTRLLAHRGLDVREVGRKCFCCDLPALLQNAGKLRREWTVLRRLPDSPRRPDRCTRKTG